MIGCAVDWFISLAPSVVVTNKMMQDTIMQDKENIPNTPLQFVKTPKHKTPYKTPKKYVVFSDQPEIQKPLFSDQELIAIQQMMQSLEAELKQTKEMLIEKAALLEKTNQKLKEAEDSATEWKAKCKSQRKTFLDNLES